MNPKAQRMTRQKKVILEILRGTKTHPTADWVYEQARKELPEISLGTVYRNLNVLRESGQIMELNYGSTFSRFDGNPANHYHFVCEQCGSVMDLDLPVLEQLEQEVASRTGLKVSHHRLEFYGLCPQCTEKGNGKTE